MDDLSAAKAFVVWCGISVVLWALSIIAAVS